MKRVILNLEQPSDGTSELIQTAFNYNINDFLIGQELHSKLRKIKRVNIFSRNASINPDYLILENMDHFEEIRSTLESSQKIGLNFKLQSKKDENELKEISNSNEINFFIVSAENWKVIPFENLIAFLQSKDIELIAKVHNLEEAELLLNTLEVGVDGVLIKPENLEDLTNLRQILSKHYVIKLTSATITDIQNISESDRVCVDTTSLLNPGEGMLVGSTAKGFVLVHAEVFETQFVASRPFRVNAGDVSAYIIVPPEEIDSEKSYRTRYLSELKGGDKVYAVNAEGNARIVTVGRVKIETRPMKRFQFSLDGEEGKIIFSCILQNAETIRLVNNSKDAVSIPDLKLGDKVLVHIGPKATHFGTKIKEKIIEK